MTEEQFLQAVLARNPGLDKPDDEVVKLKARGIKNLLRQAFQKGYEDAAEKLAKVCAASAGAGASNHRSSHDAAVELLSRMLNAGNGRGASGC